MTQVTQNDWREGEGENGLWWQRGAGNLSESPSNCPPSSDRDSLEKVQFYGLARTSLETRTHMNTQA